MSHPARKPKPKQDPSDCLDACLLDEDTQEAFGTSDVSDLLPPEDHTYHE